MGRRLIDVDKFKADYGMKDDCADCDKELRGKSKACQFDRVYTKMDFCGWLDDAPTVDAVPREIEQANKQVAYVRGYEDGQKDKYGRWVDAEPVVRCKDCKHYQFADNRAFGFPVKRCEFTGFEDVDDYDYCSRGERKDGDT